jgi:hypothetical protein
MSHAFEPLAKQLKLRAFADAVEPIEGEEASHKSTARLRERRS